jgi:hypothetical protein
MPEKIDQFYRLIFGNKDLGDVVSGDEAVNQTAKEKSMLTYMFTLENIFEPFGTDVTQFGTWKNLYTHLCEACGLAPFELTGPTCFARLFQRCRLLIQSTFPPIPALVDGLTRTTAMVYYLSGVFKLVDQQNADSTKRKELAQFSSHSEASLAAPFWLKMEETNSDSFGLNMKRMGNLIPITLVFSGGTEFNPDWYAQSHVFETLGKLKSIAKRYQDQVAAASSRTLKEEAITFLESMAFDKPEIPTTEVES